MTVEEATGAFSRDDLSSDQRSLLCELLGFLKAEASVASNIHRRTEADYARRIVAEFDLGHLAHHLEGLPR